MPRADEIAWSKGDSDELQIQTDCLLLWPDSMWVTRCSPGRSMTTALCAA